MKNRVLAAKVTWLNVRMSLAFFAACRTWLDDDLMTGLLIAGVLSANVEHIDQRPEEMRKYLPPGGVPDELRRPVNAMSVASSIGIPRETARSKLVSLTERGIFRAVDGGLILSSEVIVSAPFLTTLPAFFSAIDDFVQGLTLIGACGLGPRHGLAQPVWSVGGAATRLGSSHILRGIAHAQALGPDGPFMTQYILMVTTHLAGSDLRLLPTMPVGSGALAQLKPGLSPVSGAAVARFTNIPDETVRRHLRALVSRGALVRTDAGYDLNMDNHQLVQRWLAFQKGTKASTSQLVWKMALGGIIVERGQSV